MNENNSQTNAKSSSISGTNSSSNKHFQTMNVPASGSQSSINRPLPPVPN